MSLPGKLNKSQLHYTGGVSNDDDGGLSDELGRKKLVVRDAPRSIKSGSTISFIIAAIIGLVST